MILQHNYFTWMQPRCRVWRLVARWWKCQDAPNENCVPDLRIAFVPGGRMRPCHGIVTLGEKDLTQEDIVAIVRASKTKMARIVLERESDNPYHVQWLALLARTVRNAVPGVKLMLVAKSGWEVLESDFTDAKTLYLNWEPWRTDMGFWENVKRLWEMRRMTMRRFAGTSNKLIKPEYWSDEKKLYECDFI